MRLALATVFLLAATALYAIEVPLCYRTGSPVAKTGSTTTVENRQWRDGRELLNDLFHGVACYSIPLRLSLTFPEGDYKLPQAQASLPLFAFTRIGDGERLVMADSVDSSSVYSRLYLDANGNRDLTDDAPTSGEVCTRAILFKHVLFDPVETTVTVGGQPVCVRVRFAALRHPGPGAGARTDINMISDYYYSGAFDLDGGRCQVAVVDRNCDGRITADGGGGRPADSLYMKRDGCITENDAMPFSRSVVVGSHTFAAEFDPQKPALRLRELKSDGAILELVSQPQRILLKGDTAEARVVMYDPAREVRVPQGRYTLDRYVWERRDRKGDLWRIQADGRWTSPVVAAIGQRSSMPFGEPYMPTVAAGAFTQNPGGPFGVLLGIEPTMLEFRLVGAGGEIARPVQHIEGDKTLTPLSSSNRKYPKEPTYRVMKSHGQVVAHGSFQYDEEGTCSATWDGYKKGTQYVTECSYAPGPFRTRIEKQPLVREPMK